MELHCNSALSGSPPLGASHSASAPSSTQAERSADAALATQPLEPSAVQTTLEKPAIDAAAASAAASIASIAPVPPAAAAVASGGSVDSAAATLRPDQVQSKLKLNPSWPLVASDEWRRMADFAELLQVRVHLVEAARQRLLDLWDAVLMIGADEIGDWALPAHCEVTASGAQAVPDVLGMCATVYADGTVSLYVQFDGIDAPFWLEEQVQLDALNRLAHGPGGTSQDRIG